MDVIVLAARKGGVGKTLMTASLAVLAERTSRAEQTGGVAIIDFDPQGCLTNWQNSRDLQGPYMTETTPTRLGVTLEQLALVGTRYVFIDTPPGHSDIVTTAMRAASLIVIPVKPSELDLAATLRTATAAERLGLPYVLLPNDATYRSRAMGQSIRLLRDAGMPLLSAVHHRVDLMLGRGRTASEAAPRSRGAQELDQVWSEMANILEEQDRD